MEKSYKANRFEYLKSPPMFSELISKVLAMPIDLEEKAFFALAITSGARVSEICNVKRKDITLLDGLGNIIDHADASLYAVSTVKIIYTNLKRREKDKRGIKIPNYKTVPMINNEIFSPLVDIIIKRVQEIMPDDHMYSKNRVSAWRLVKKMSPDFWPHIFRHYYVSNLIRSGIAPSIIKTAAGWKGLETMNAYTHLSSIDIERALKEHYGEGINKLGNPLKPLPINTMIGALAAAHEVDGGRVLSKHHMLQTKSTILVPPTAPVQIHLPEYARIIRDNILKKEYKIPEEDNGLMVV